MLHSRADILSAILLPVNFTHPCHNNFCKRTNQVEGHSVFYIFYGETYNALPELAVANIIIYRDCYVA